MQLLASLESERQRGRQFMHAATFVQLLRQDLKNSSTLDCLRASGGKKRAFLGSAQIIEVCTNKNTRTHTLAGYV